VLCWREKERSLKREERERGSWREGGNWGCNRGEERRPGGRERKQEGDRKG
jgi:hypothetical protein